MTSGAGAGRWEGTDRADAARCVLIALLDRGRWLQIRRAPGIAGAGRVCFPTGRVEPGESLEETVVREAAEELGVTVRVVASLGDAPFPDDREHVFGFVVEIVGGEILPAPEEVAEVLWLTPDGIAAHPDRLLPSEVFAGRLPGP